ncbi:MAG: ELM1/GtrOC1 family putative glycosyltransferase [Candidatus Wallbacteria bacterium]|nr:ELM1/GtrOC1 family putative glycosyltransferase [Candidatus Wallbacteria bacterium]
MAVAAQQMANKALILSDGKPGHFYQSIGLADDLVSCGYLSGYEVRKIDMIPDRIRWHQIRNFFWEPDKALAAFFKDPDTILSEAQNFSLLIETGSTTATLAVILHRLLPKLKLIHILKPLFFNSFDLILLPKHDTLFFERLNLLRFLVGFNVVSPVKAEKHGLELEKMFMLRKFPREQAVSLLVGGDSRDYELNWPDLQPILQELAALKLHLLLTTSRRTPLEVSRELKKFTSDYPLTELSVFVDENYYNPLPGLFSLADSVLVTEDSFSMISEAVSSGRKTGVLLSREVQNKKIRKSISEMVFEGLVFPLWGGTDLQAFLSWSPLRTVSEEKDQLISEIVKRLTQEN